MGLEEDVKKLKTVVDRLTKRPTPQKKLFVTPYPIFGYEENPLSGVVFRGLFYVDGSITGGAISIDEMPEGGVVLSAIVKDGDGERAVSFGIKKDIVSIDRAVEVKAGSKVIVKVTPVNPEKEVKGIWTSLLWTPSIKSLRRIGDDS